MSMDVCSKSSSKVVLSGYGLEVFEMSGMSVRSQGKRADAGKMKNN